MRQFILPPSSLALAAIVLAGHALADTPRPELIDCWEAEASLLDSTVCDDPVLKALDDSLAEQLADSPGAMPVLHATLAESCGLSKDEGEFDAIRRLERAGCLAPRYRALLGDGIADAPPTPLPPDAVHPLCLGMAHALWGEPEIAELPMDACRRGTAHIPVDRDPDGTISARGLSIGSPTFVAITPLGPLPDGRSTAIIRQNTGGTGVFSALVAYTIGPTLAVETLVPGGDRCNGGISSARRDGPDWIVAFNITPLDIAEVIGAGDEPGAEDLPSCAICCAAEVDIRFPPDGDGEVLSLQAWEARQGSNGGDASEACLLRALGGEAVPSAAFASVREGFTRCLQARAPRAP